MSDEEEIGVHSGNFEGATVVIMLSDHQARALIDQLLAEDKDPTSEQLRQLGPDWAYYLGAQAGFMRAVKGFAGEKS